MRIDSSWKALVFQYIDAATPVVEARNPLFHKLTMND